MRKRIEKLIILTCFAVALLCLVCASPSKSEASGCRRINYSTYCPTPVRKIVVHPPKLVAPVKKVVHDPYKVRIIEERIKEVPVYPDYYFSLGGAYRDSLLADAIAYRTALLLQGQQLPQSYVPRYPLKNGDRKIMPQANDMPPEDATVPKGLRAVVDKHCLRCHGPEKQGGGLSLASLSAIDKGGRWHAHGLVNSGEMPKGGKALTDQEVVLFYQWAKSSK